MTVGATNALFLAMQVGHGDMDIKLSIETRNFGIVSNLLHVFTCPACPVLLSIVVLETTRSFTEGCLGSSWSWSRDCGIGAFFRAVSVAGNS